MLLAACGATRAPQYASGSYGGGTVPTTTTTAPRASNRASGTVIGVASKFVQVNWADNPKWPTGNYVYVLDRPYLTATINGENAVAAAKPLPAAVVSQWRQDKRFKIGASVDVTSAWIQTDAGVTPTTCVVEVTFIVSVTNNGVIQGATGQSYEYAFQMQKLGGRWLVASQPQEPE